ncbi:TVP38/TMEM64 family protein [Clostridium hydrogeniformans]|uniref:TVP38/TMEM64 family protein n=1 Tax=Clostridium hydrogeniformans TaxID=349933 RepID=UPI00068A72A3|nr:TVP38/TMEM64 family protein [Clostridium hydrogeniformans]
MNKQKLKTILKILLFLVLLLIVIKLLGHAKLLHKLRNLDSLIEFIKLRGKYAAVVFFIMFSLKPLILVLPSAMMSVAAGVIFGPVYGFILNMVGFFFSGTIAFFISRFLGKDFVDKILKGKALKINQNLDKNGFKVLLLLRLPPVLPYDPLSYTCGLSNMRYVHFITASLIGVMPETLCYSIMGENFRDPLSAKFLIPLGVVIVATILSGFAFKKAKDN